MAKQKAPKRLWAILDQEDIALCICVAKTAGGALYAYENKTGRSRLGLNAEALDISDSCALLPAGAG